MTSVVQLFHNPSAGSYSARAIDRLVAALRHEGAEVILSPSIDRVPSIDPDATHLCIAGGDGTIRHVAAALVGSACRLPVAVYPAGTVNLLAREWQASHDPRTVARGLLRGDAGHLHNPVICADGMFLTCASIGPDSAAVALLSSRLKARIGRLAYVAAFLTVLWRWPRPRLTVTADGTAMDCEALYVAKGRYYAGPWSFAPAARADDGLLHVLALRRARRRDYLRFVMALALGRDPAKTANAAAFTCTSLSISGDARMPIQADGDIVASCPIDLRIADRPIAFC